MTAKVQPDKNNSPAQQADIPDITAVTRYFSELQDEIVTRLEGFDGQAQFSREFLENPNGGESRPRVLANGQHIEKAAVQYTHSIGTSLPEAATERNPDLAGHPFQAAAISMIVHPCNPYAPTTHMNLRFFLVEAQQPFWYFGGGFDLTPIYGFEQDCVHWHETARDAVGQSVYTDMKRACDEYFVLTHRNEPRGIGGLFYDDLNADGFAASFALTQAVGNAFLPAYMPIIERRVRMPFSQRERDFQLYRRGRYAEFNLAIDRGTKYGIQSGRRIESVLASLPPLAAWHYNYEAEAGSAEEALTREFLVPRDWV